ncbi:unnamed protein product [Rotaria sp. Silwood1]|nr:unnamed protein product [Rotaria sp. Silwood1]
MLTSEAVSSEDLLKWNGKNQESIQQQLIFDRSCVNLESNQIVWLNSNNKNIESITKNFRLLVDYIKQLTIWWYTRDSFIYRILNKALRQNNIELLFLFGFFVQDMYRQLKDIYELDKKRYTNENQVVMVYRGQLMSRHEIPILRINTDHIGNNAFFSTTMDRSLALFYTGPGELTDEFQSVLFEIELNVHDESYLPFADISHLSSFPNESEILFMIGTQFMLSTVNDQLDYDNTERIWKIKLKVRSNDRIQDLKNLQSSTQRKTLKNWVNIIKSSLCYSN